MSSHTLFLSIIIPVHNNAPTLPVILQKLATALQEKKYEVIFIDDASTDSSYDALKKISSTASNSKTISLEKNIGQWEATLLGISHAAGEYIITIDADLQYDPDNIPKLYQHLVENKLLLVYGIPFRMLHGLGGLRNKLQSLILRKSLTSSFKIFHRSIVFDHENRFIANRHFEAYEKFNLRVECKGWLHVNTSESKRGGFRNNLIRNTRIMLTYLPEYNRHFRHPLTLYGLILLTGCSVPAVIMLVKGTSLTNIFLLALFFSIETILLAAGIKWKIKYRKILQQRKQLLSKRQDSN